MRNCKSCKFRNNKKCYFFGITKDSDNCFLHSAFSKTLGNAKRLLKKQNAEKEAYVPPEASEEQVQAAIEELF